MTAPLIFLTLALLSPRLMATENLLTPESETRLKAALGDLYTMDFNKTNDDFAQIIRDEPDNPFTYLSEAGALWWETAAHAGIAPVPTRLKKRFEKDLERSIQGANILLKSRSLEDQAKGHFIMGLSLGELGEWDFLNHHWLKAFFNGKKALNHLKACLKIDSTYYDAYIGLGSYDYQVSRFSFLLKAGALLGGLHANEQRGIEHLIMAEDRGRYSSDQAAIFLATLYALDKKDYKTALSIIQKLRKEYPNSLYFEFIEIGLREKLGDWRRSLALGRDAFNQIKSDPEAYRKRLLDTACGFSPSNCLDKAESAEIVAWTNRAIDNEEKSEHRDPQMLALFHLYRGFGEDILGLRGDAESDYKWAVNSVDFLDDHAQAERCLQSPCDRRQILNFLRMDNENYNQHWKPKK